MSGLTRRGALSLLAMASAAPAASLAACENGPDETDVLKNAQWEAWVHSPDEFVPPTNEEWCGAVNPTLIAIRMAWLSCYKTKPELIDMLRRMDAVPSADEDKDSSLAVMFASQIADARDRIAQLAAVLDCAHARLASAGLNT